MDANKLDNETNKGNKKERPLHGGDRQTANGRKDGKDTQTVVNKSSLRVSHQHQASFTAQRKHTQLLPHPSVTEPEQATGDYKGEKKV